MHFENEFKEENKQSERPLNTELQADWGDIIHRSAFTINGVCERYSLKRKTLIRWLNGTQQPRGKNKEKIVRVMADLIVSKRLEKHPSFGFSTKKQVDLLNSMSIGPARTVLLRQIEQQNKMVGKIA